MSPGLAQLLSEGGIELMAGTFFLLLQQVLQCSEFCAVPGSKIASSKIQVLLSHAAVYPADRGSLIFR